MIIRSKSSKLWAHNQERNSIEGHSKLGKGTLLSGKIVLGRCLFGFRGASLPFKFSSNFWGYIDPIETSYLFLDVKNVGMQHEQWESSLSRGWAGLIPFEQTVSWHYWSLASPWFWPWACIHVRVDVLGSLDGGPSSSRPRPFVSCVMM